MMRVGAGKPRIGPHEDRWGRVLRSYYVTDHAWVCVEKWRQIEIYQEGFNESQAFMMLLGKDRVEEMVKARLALAGGKTVWEMDAYTRDFKGCMRLATIYGQKFLVRWTWWEAHVVWRWLHVRVWFMNHQPRWTRRR